MPDEYRKPIAANKRAKFKGRSKGAPFLAIEHRIADSEEFGRLSGNAVKLLLELARQYRPGKNGDLSIPWSLLHNRGWRSKATVHAAKLELLESGWVVETRKGGKHLCSLYAISYYAIDESEKHTERATTLPLNLWQQKRNA
ncbi:hypothetical protein ABQZ69_03705 [Xanthomonas sp. WHRI 8391]|uniref:hypothetical protein n=1 Tax=Xanthomonas TaxID=338 RepID=UPI001A334CC9|nr:hypothetical protein [Xanthomonas hortorum]MBG3850074.1 hypothetical protein [Xanthomonas hortorum pv. carotae]UTS72706.1 hypothetical protein NMB96_20090 [Xanthomonas hortorum]